MTQPRDTTVPEVTLAMLYRLLGVREHESGRELIRRGRLVSPRLPQLLISAAQRENVPLGTGTSDELRRARNKALQYGRLYDAVRTRVPAVRLVKGPSLARWYPTDLLRPVGDLDLVVESEEQLWEAARTLYDGVPVDRIDLALQRHDGRTHVTVGLHWPSEDELLDRPYNIELTTLPLPGDAERTVPPRATLPGDQTLADVLSLAEERFQRAFNVKDAVDVLMLFGQSPPDPVELAENARCHRLAPELLELVTYARTGTGAAFLDDFLTPLARPAAAELSCRKASADEPPVALGTGTVDGRLRAGIPVPGLQLTLHQREVGSLGAHRHDSDGVTLLCTPVGDFLLVCEEVVSRDSYDTALSVLDRLEADR
ncbi:nucleotidyltransferase family protein [Streptomyces sp. NPDC101455]|uniref:nucleotidyltransferase family protein n=1 Tax=Streptomyces sp. NPDC101455 TaxID=3366142 RepID=UPI0038249BFA